MNLDTQILDLINRQWTSPFLDWLMAFVSCLNAWVPVFVIAGAVVLWKYRVRGLMVLVAAAMTVGVADAVISNSLKKTINRLRPSDTLTWVLRRDLAKQSPRFLAIFEKPVTIPAKIVKPGSRGNSMPSSHIVNITTATVFLFLLGGHRRWWLSAVPLLMAYSRVYCGAHWPSDVPPSLLIGALTGYLGYRVFGNWLRRGNPWQLRDAKA
jgi:undecaprenyl-diphosphatase